MDKEKAVACLVIGVLVAALAGFVLYTLWNDHRTHERHVDRIKGSFSSSATHGDPTGGVLG